MFAVPGWAVSAEALKTQHDPSSQSYPVQSSLGDSSKTSSRKRKRKHGQPNGVSVTEENLAEMWKKHIEGGIKKHVNQESKGKLSSEKRRTVEWSAGGKDRDGGSEDLRQGKHKSAAEKPWANRESASLKVDNAVPLSKSSQAVSDTPGHAASQDDYKESGKARYEERMRKRQEKAAMKASGAPKSSQTPHEDTDIKASSKGTGSKLAKTKAPTQPRHRDRVLEAEMPQKASSIQATQTDDEAQLPSSNSPKPAPSTTPKPLPPRPPPPSQPQLPPTKNLTPLQRSMQAKLLSSRFRHLNETLYTSPSTTAQQLFTSTPSAYTAYHAGFRAQVAVWPQNPIGTFISDLKLRGRVRRESLTGQKHAWKAQKRTPSGKKKPAAKETQTNVEALPRTGGLCTIADLGCGDAQLAGSLQQQQQQQTLNLRIHSFDLAPGDGPYAHLITVADVTRLLPLRDGEVDLAICCLSLMGTNWVDAVDETARVLRAGGEVWVAETKSRFGRRRQSPGDETKPRVRQSKKNPADEEEEEGFDAVEIDSDPEIFSPQQRKKTAKKMERGGGGEDETDVSAFVEVWRRRGFELKGEVDMGNKMFVRMRFVKKAGKGERGGDVGSGRGQRKTRFIDNEEEEGISRAEEAKVLKPCVYKTR